MKKGLFIDFEGIDGSGTSTHVHELTRRIEVLDKYQDVLRTHEPWRNKEIKRRLQKERDPYSGPREMAELYIGDRTDHTYRLINPNLDAEVIVLCSRYKMSTCAFQWASGVSLRELVKMHENRGILTPNLTFFLDIPREVAQERTKKRKEREKFERDAKFIDDVIEKYRSLANCSPNKPELFGKVVRIDANRPINEVAEDIYQNFLPLYNQWAKSD
jgi:dTMP kinase